MQRLLMACVLCIGLPTLAAAGGDAKLPAAPKGFTWKRVESIKASFLMPDGWHFREEKKGNTTAVFLTQEDIGKEGKFKTGLSLNLVKGLKTPAQDYARRFIETMGQQHKQLKTWTTTAGPFKGYGCQVLNTPRDGGPAVMIHALAIGNAKMNTLYLFIFESPEAGWKEAWKIGEAMLKTLPLDDEV
jgi:hypothetical protein